MEVGRPPMSTMSWGQLVTQGITDADGFLLGRKTYDIFANYWPKVTDPNSPIATALNSRPKYVVSRSLERVAWNNWKRPVAHLSAAQALVVALLRQLFVRPVSEQNRRELRVDRPAVAQSFAGQQVEIARNIVPGLERVA